MVQTTKPSFSSRSNAKRAAEKMIVDGKAPAVDYAIRPCHDGRFEIIWKATRAAPTTEEVAAEFTAATETATSGSAPEMGAEPAVTSDSEPAAADTTRTESESAEAENLFPAGTWVTVRKGKHKAIVGQVTQRIGSNTWRVHEFGKPESWTQLATAVQLSCAEEPAPEAPKPARRSRRSTTITPAKPSRSQYAINADMIAAGKSPRSRPWSPQRPTHITRSGLTRCTATPPPVTGMRCAITRSLAATATQKWSRATAKICWPFTPAQ